MFKYTINRQIKHLQKNKKNLIRQDQRNIAGEQ